MSDQQPTANPKRASTTEPPANKGLRSVSSLDIHTLTLDPSRPSPPPSATSPTTPWTDAIEDWQLAAAHDQDMANAQQILDTLNQLLQQNQQIATRLDQQDQALANLHAAQPNNAQIARLVTANAVAALPLAPNIVAPVNEANVITRLRYELATNMSISTALKQDIANKLHVYDQCYVTAPATAQQVMLQELTVLATRLAINPRHAAFVQESLACRALGIEGPAPPRFQERQHRPARGRGQRTPASARRGRAGPSK